MRPPTLSTSHASGSASSSWASSPLTAMRIAWKVRLAGWPPAKRAGAGIAAVIASLSSKVVVSSARGKIHGTAMVTKRLPTLKIDGKEVWQIGFPIHWGFAGDSNHTGPLANMLTPSAIDPNTWTPEYKAFQVQLEKADQGEKQNKGDQGEPAKKSEGRA